MPPCFLSAHRLFYPTAVFMWCQYLLGVVYVHMLICQSILAFIEENIVNLGYTPCTLFYKDILHSFYPKTFILISDYRLLEMGELYDGLGLVEEASAGWWAVCLGTAQQLGCGQGAAAARYLAPAQPQWWQRGSSTISPHGSQSSLNIASYKGLFELTGCWTHSPFQKGVKQKSDVESDREYVNNKWMR